MIRIKYSDVRNISCLYLLAPFAVFAAAWLKWFVSVPCLLLLAAGLYRQRRDKPTFGRSVRMRAAAVLLLALISLIWCQSAGIGGFFYQSPDHNYRNAVFHDLVSHSWPVVYERYDTGMVYYLGIWIVPAAAGRLLIWAGAGEAAAWLAARELLLFWCTAGIALCLLLLCLYCQRQSVKDVLLLAMILIGFSGWDIVGQIWKGGWPLPDHIEWWSGYFQLRSNTTALFWAYNQAIPCWLMSALLLLEEDMRSYGLILAAALFYSPFGAAGSLLCVCALILRHIRGGHSLRELFSLQSMMPVCAIVPILWGYYRCNAGMNAKIRLCWNDYGGLTMGIAATWLVFLCLEAGPYAAAVIGRERKEPLVYAVLLTLIVNSPLAVGEKGEVAYQLSAVMPAVFLLMCLTAKTLFCAREEGARGARRAGAILLALLVGAATPAVEYGRAVRTIREEGTLFAVADEMKTLDTKDAPHNFTAGGISENPFFRFALR